MLLRLQKYNKKMIYANKKEKNRPNERFFHAFGTLGHGMTIIVIKVLGASALPTERTLLAFIGDPRKGLAVMTCVIGSRFVPNGLEAS